VNEPECPKHPGRVVVKCVHYGGDYVAIFDNGQERPGYDETRYTVHFHNAALINVNRARAERQFVMAEKELRRARWLDPK